MAAPINTSGILRVDGAAGGSTSTLNAGFTFTGGNDAVVDLSHWNNNAGQYIASVTIGGTAATLIARGANGQFVSEQWHATNIAGGTPNVVITFAVGSSGNYVSGGAQEWAAADNLTYDTGTANSATGTGTAPSVATAATTSQPNTVVIASATAGVGGNANVGLSGPTGWTAAWTEQDDSNHIAGRGAYSEETTAGTKTATFAQTASGGWAATVAAYTVTVGAPPQEAYPNADVTDGAWTPSAGTDLFAVLDDASDADYITTNSNTTGKIGLAALSTPVAGTQTLAFRASGSPAKKLIATLIEGAGTSRGTVTVDPLPATATDYSFSPSGISNYADLDIQYEIADATTPPTISVTFGGIGTGANGSASISVPVPAAIAAGDYLLLHITSGATNSETPATPSGWTLLATGASTDGTFGVDTGPRRATVFGKVAVGGETAVTVTTTNGNTVRGTMSRWAKQNNGYLWDVVAQGANDSTSGTGVSMTTAAIAWAVGDCAAVVTGQRVDSATQSAQSLTASGTTFGTRTNRANTAVTTGNDHRHVVDTFGAVTTGGGSAATTWAYTASAACSAGGVIVRLREVPPTEFGRVYTTKLTIPEAAGGGGIDGLISEALTLAESCSASVLIGATMIEAATLADAPSAASSREAPVSEALTLADSPAAGGSSAGSITEAASLADSPSSTKVTAGTQSEALSLAETSSNTVGLVASVSEAATLADSPSGASSVGAAVSEALTLAESPQRTAGTSGTQSEAITLAETSAAGGVVADSVTEAMVLGESSTRTASMPATITEALSLIESSSAASTLSAVLTEALSLGSVQSVVVSLLTAVTEAITLAETSNNSTGPVALLSEAMSLSDIVSSASNLLAMSSEALTLVDTSVAAQTAVASILEGLALVDQTQWVGGAVSASISEALSLVDSTSATRGLAALIAESINTSSVESALMATMASIQESLALAEVTSNGGQGVALVTESLTLGANQDAGVSYVASITEPLTLSNTQSSISTIAATILESMALLESSGSISTQTAVTIEALDLQDQTLAGSTYQTLITESMSLSDLMLWLSGVFSDPNFIASLGRRSFTASTVVRVMVAQTSERNFTASWRKK